MENIIIASLSNSIQNVNHLDDLKNVKLKLSISSDTIDKTDESNKKVKSYKKKKKKKKKLIKPPQIQTFTLTTSPIRSKKPKNPYRLFLLYKLSKKYESKSQIYDVKKINELIFNIPSHFTAIFKEYLIKEEEVEFLERLYNKIEIRKKLKKIFYFYDKFSKIFPNYIVVPEGHYLYKNILKKQKIIDKIQKIKEEELKNKQMLLEGSFNTIFSNGAVDSIYSNMESNNNLTLSNILFLDKNDKEDEEMQQIEKIVDNIKKYENIINNTKIESLIKKQTIYKKEFRDMRSFSIDTKNKKEYKGETNSNNQNNEKKRSEENLSKNKINKKKNAVKNKNNNNGPIIRKKFVQLSDNYRCNTEDELDDYEKENDNYHKKQDNNIRNNYRMINMNQDNNNTNPEKNEDEIIMRKKKKKYIILSGKHFLQNIDTDEKSIEKLFNTYTNEDENIESIKSRNNLIDEKELFYSRNTDGNFRNSFTQNKSQSKSFLKTNKNSMLYRKKLINDSRGLSISRKNTGISNNNNTNKAKVTYTLNGTKIVPIKKYKISSKRDVSSQNTERDIDNENFYTYLYEDKKQRLLKEDNNNTINNSNEKEKKMILKTITTSKSNHELIEKNKNNTNSLNGNVYYKKYKYENLRNFNVDKSCPRREMNKHLDDTYNDNDSKKRSVEKKKDKDKSNNNNNNINNNNMTYRYQRMNHNNKKFRLKAPMNYYKIDVI